MESVQDVPNAQKTSVMGIVMDVPTSTDWGFPNAKDK